MQFDGAMQLLLEIFNFRLVDTVPYTMVFGIVC